MRWILDLDNLLLVSGIARKHGIVPKPFLGRPQYFPPPKKIHFLPRTRDFLRKRVCGFSNQRLQENIFNRANLFGGGQSYYSPPFSPPNPVSSRATRLDMVPAPSTAFPATGAEATTLLGNGGTPLQYCGSGNGRRVCSQLKTG
jgi:hypothetical protein